MSGVVAKFKALSEIDLSKSIAEINKLKESLNSAAVASQSLAAANREAGVSAQTAAAAETAMTKARQAQAAMIASNTQATRDAYAAAYRLMSDVEKSQFEMEDRLKELNRLYAKSGTTEADLTAKRAEYEAAKAAWLTAQANQPATAATTPAANQNAMAYTSADLAKLLTESMSQLNIGTDTGTVRELQNLATIMESVKWNKPSTTFNIDFKQYGSEVDPSELIDAIKRAMKTAI